MAAVTLLAAAAQAPTGTGSAVDVSAHAQLRLDIVAQPNLGTGPELEVWIDTGPAAVGPWTEIYRLQMSAGHPPHAPLAWLRSTRALVGNFDAFARVRWSARATKNSGDGNPQLTLGVTGEGV